jgi:hypothetical protein
LAKLRKAQRKMNRVLAKFVFFAALSLLLQSCLLEDMLSVKPLPTFTAATTQEVLAKNTPVSTVTKEVLPVPTSVGKSCLLVVANQSLNLRPSPSDQNYPIMALKDGDQLLDLGGRDGKWIFVEFGDKQGWVSGEYVKGCE